MAETVFKEVRYDLQSLAKFIELGEIGLPDLQRPFVWKNAKIRDLFDSMYRGYPVGYLLFWQNSGTDDSHGIGVEDKQKPPRLLIVDGQQRLTSLYAVIKGVSVVRENYDSEKIEIAFNPLNETFEVADAAVRRDSAFLPNISSLWAPDADLFEVVDAYIEGLESVREVSSSEKKSIRQAIQKAQQLVTFPFTALELASDISEEQVAEVFVRINSKGKPLNQSDFILTLMSVFWDTGRKALEQFCRGARTPTVSEKSAFNHHFQPDPDHLLRVGVGLSFRRARLQHVYSILRGKDLETGEFSTERRNTQFELLRASQAKVLNLQYWHDFFKAVQLAGYRGGKMIGSTTALVQSYTLYLIGRTEFGIEESTLRRAIAEWFFMSSITGRYSASPESQMEQDLGRLRAVKDAESFLSALSAVSQATLTRDFWEITLPNDLASSSARSPALFAYYASLNMLDAPALYSTQRASDLLDPWIQAPRSALERHHLFPKGYGE